MHPEIRTYAGNGIDDPGLSIRMDVTPMGFHASVRSPGGAGAWYVDPAYNRRGESRHLSYYGADVPRSAESFVERDAGDTAEAIAAATEQIGPPDGAVVQKDYRLALVTDPSYATYFGAANVSAEKATLINRVNQVYMDDLAIQFLLVANNDLLNLNTAALATTAGGPCGANACYTTTQLADGCTGDLLNRNVFVIGQIIGADNYDIGHIGLGINGGGVAGLGVVGGRGKARGCTGLPFPEGDFFAIDYVAHEIGHQMGGNHTFNGTQLNCAAPNRNTDTTLVEPGSGLLGDGLRRHLPAGQPAAAQRPLLLLRQHPGDHRHGRRRHLGHRRAAGGQPQELRRFGRVHDLVRGLPQRRQHRDPGCADLQPHHRRQRHLGGHGPDRPRPRGQRLRQR